MRLANYALGETRINVSNALLAFILSLNQLALSAQLCAIIVLANIIVNLVNIIEEDRSVIAR